MSDFKKWDIIFPKRYPESIACSQCNKDFTLGPKWSCSHCGYPNHVSNIITKIRPIILWTDKNNWYSSMAFGIPLTTTKLFDDTYNETIKISHCSFVSVNSDHQKPMRAVICQATRVDANTFNTRNMIGNITDEIVKSNIETKLVNWIFQ